MAHIVNPYNLDDSDDAVFSALLSQGLIWVEDDDENDDKDGIDAQDIVDEASGFLSELDGEWVNFSRLCQHLYATFGKDKLKQLEGIDQRYKSLLKLFSDYPYDFDILWQQSECVFNSGESNTRNRI